MGPLRPMYNKLFTFLLLSFRPGSPSCRITEFYSHDCCSQHSGKILTSCVQFYMLLTFAYGLSCGKILDETYWLIWIEYYHFRLRFVFFSWYKHLSAWFIKAQSEIWKYNNDFCFIVSGYDFVCLFLFKNICLSNWPIGFGATVSILHQSVKYNKFSVSSVTWSTLSFIQLLETTRPKV